MTSELTTRRLYVSHEEYAQFDELLIFLDHTGEPTCSREEFVERVAGILQMDSDLLLRHRWKLVVVKEVLVRVGAEGAA